MKEGSKKSKEWPRVSEMRVANGERFCQRLGSSRGLYALPSAGRYIQFSQEGRVTENTLEIDCGKDEDIEERKES
jgi:hypothetical protein